MSEAFDMTLSQASRLVPGRPHVTSIWRWCRKGVLARNGMRIHLEHRRFGGRIFTSSQALDRFSKQLADADLEHFDGPEADAGTGALTRDPESRAQDRSQRVEAAQRRLREMGFSGNTSQQDEPA